MSQDEPKKFQIQNRMKKLIVPCENTLTLSNTATGASALKAPTKKVKSLSLLTGLKLRTIVLTCRRLMLFTAKFYFTPFQLMSKDIAP